MAWTLSVTPRAHATCALAGDAPETQEEWRGLPGVGALGLPPGAAPLGEASGR